MEKYNVIFLPEAYKDLDDIFDYILLDNHSQAEFILAKIIDSISTLEAFPLIGKKLIHKSLNYYNFRMIIIDPYIAFYRFIDDVVYIYRILHGARDYINTLESM